MCRRESFHRRDRRAHELLGDLVLRPVRGHGGADGHECRGRLASRLRRAHGRSCTASSWARSNAPPRSAPEPGRLAAPIAPPIEFPPLANFTIRDALVHMASHNAHHLGQVIILRQIMGLWPPPSGSYTW